MKKYRIFLGFCEVAGYYSNLLKGFKKLYVPTTPVFLNEDKYGYLDKNYTEEYFTKRIVNLTKRYYAIKRRNVILKLFFYFLLFSFKFALFIRAVTEHNIFIFSYGQSFFNLRDLYILRLLKKKIIFVYHGSDCRPPYLNGVYYDEEKTDYKKLADLSKKMKKSVDFVQRYANYVVNLPSQAQFFEKKFINWMAVGIPIRIDNVEVNKSIKKEKLKVIHAPTRPKQKGSDEFRAAIKIFQEQGYEIDYVEITGKKNSEILSELRKSDIVLDELYSDSPMAGLGSEAAFCGKPVVVCGYYAKHYRYDFSGIDMPPSLYCEPKMMEITLKKLLDDEICRDNCGSESRLFISQKWSPEEVAKRFISLFENNFPDDWFYDPAKLHYFKGWGLKEENLIEIIRKMHEKFGDVVFILNHNKKLMHRLKNFCGINDKTIL